MTEQGYERGVHIIRYRTLVKALETVLECCVEMAGSRDPEAVMAALGVATQGAAEMVGGDAEEIKEGLREVLDSPEYQEAFLQKQQEMLLKMKTAVWGAVDRVSAWAAEDEECRSMLGKTISPQPSTREELFQLFEETVGAWMTLEQPELMFAERAHDALERLMKHRARPPRRSGCGGSSWAPCRRTSGPIGSR